MEESINGLESVLANQTWNLLGIPKGSKTIGCKWIFWKKLKYDEFKAMLVAKDFKQKE